MRTTRLSVDWQLGPFLLSALIGLIIAFDPLAASVRFVLIVTGVGLYVIFSTHIEDLSGPQSKRRWLLAALPVCVSIYFLITNDWARWGDKLPVFNPITSRLAELQFVPSTLSLNPNIAGGVIAAYLPLQFQAVKYSRRGIKFILLGISMIGLVLSETRGAWLALLLTLPAWLAWKQIRARVPSLSQARRMWLFLIVAITVALGVLVTATPIGVQMLRLGGDRQNIWQNSFDLARDYAMTGWGLGSFELAYSTYSVLLHVGHTLHAHNLWLNVWLEQGLLGLIALAGLVVNGLWPASTSSIWRTGALMATSVILLHGLVDDAFYGYGGAAIPLLFIPIGLLRPTSDRPVWRQPASMMWAVGIAGGAIGLLLPIGRAVLIADLAAVQQTRAELTTYRWPDVPIQDALRRSNAVQLSPIVAQYEAALALDPANATALWRLGQIELARSDYAVACQHLAAAQDVRPDQRAVRQLLGECAAFEGRFDEATELWRKIDLSQGQISIRHWWYESYLNQPDRAAALRRAAQGLD